MKSVARTVLVSGMVALFLLFLASRFTFLVGGIDFPDFYCAGVMARQHADLYDAAAQQECQVQTTGRRGTYYIHPPFEALAFVPLSFLSLRQAYLLWNLIGCVLLALAMRAIAGGLGWWDWGRLVALSLLYPPVLLNFVQGQDSILLLAVIAVSFAAWERKQYFAAGLLLGLGLFKFHIVWPLALLLLIRGRLKFAAGFILSALLLFGVSGAAFGWNVFDEYAQFLGSLPQLPMSGVHWQAMGNIRGLVGLFASDESRGVQVLIGVLSVALLLVGMGTWLRAGKSRELQRLAFGATVLIAILVGYHLNPHDLALLLIPFAVLADWALKRTGWQRWLPACLIALLFLPPIHLLLLSSRFYGLIGILVIALLVVVLVAVACGDRASAEAAMP